MWKQLLKSKLFQDKKYNKAGLEEGWDDAWEGMWFGIENSVWEHTHTKKYHKVRQLALLHKPSHTTP